MILLQPDKGTYALLLELPTETLFPRVGPFGAVTLPAGDYIYVGSAFGSGGVKGRVGHHLRRAARPHWHLDYVRPGMVIREAWVTYDRVRRECEWSRLVRGFLRGRVVAPGFGSADCRVCPAHFYHFDARPRFDAFRHWVALLIADHAPVHRRMIGKAAAAPPASGRSQSR